MYHKLYLGRDHPVLAVCLNNLGIVLLGRGEPGGAEKHLRDALAMCRKLYPDRDHPNLANCLISLGIVLWDRGDPGGAEKHLRDALAMQQRFLLREAGLLAEADALNLAATFGSTRDAFLSVTRGRADDPTVYELIWQGRSALTRLVEQRHRDLLASNDPSTRDLGEKLLSARQRLSHLLLAPTKEAAKHAEEVRKLTEAKEDLEMQLTQKLRLELPPADPIPPPPKRLAAVLPAGACFLDFYRYTHFEFAPQGKGKTGVRGTPHYMAFVLGKDKSVVRVELGAAALLEQAWASWHQAITSKGASYDRERKAAAVVAGLVWEPVRAKLPPGVKTLYLAPDQALTQLPWAALPGKSPDTVLLEEYIFATVPHGPFLQARLKGKDAPRPKGGTLLAVGGVDYARPPDLTPAVAAAGVLALSGKRVVWPPLPGTQAELERVTAVARKQGGLTARPFSQGAADAARILAELPKARYAHFATHGFFADAEFRSAFQVDPEQFLRLTPDRRGGARSPLVLSGLVFTGANRQGKDAAEDRGILTAEALVGLRLDKLELAVLSACETGLGEVGGGDGVYGLQRAFHVAGCKDVIASLWEVGDKSTAALMGLFYRNLWERQLDPMQSLRQAQLELYRHPEHIDDLSRSGKDWTPRPLYKENPNPPGQRARTAQWAAFTFSGVAAPARAEK
jgi:CHAT domain-containing protein